MPRKKKTDTVDAVHEARKEPDHPFRKKEREREAKVAEPRDPNMIYREDGSTERAKTPHDHERPDLNAVRVFDITTGDVINGPHPAELVLDNDLERYRYSHSFLKTYASCHFKGYANRMKAPCRKIFVLERGTVAHSVIEDLEKNPELDIEARLNELWKSEILDKYDKFNDDDKATINGEGFEETLWMVEDWRHENIDLILNGSIRPEDVEVEFKLPATMVTEQGSFQRIFTGKLDLVLWNKERTKYGIFDFKTSVKAPDEDALAIEPQFTLYQWAATQLFGFPPSAMFWYHLRGKHKSPEEHDPPLLVSKGPNKGKPLQKTPSFGENHPRVPECLKYAFDMPIRTQDVIDDYFNNFAAGIIIAYESGDMTKTGRADPVNQCSRCQYKEYCDETPIRLPFHVRVAS